MFGLVAKTMNQNEKKQMAAFSRLDVNRSALVLHLIVTLPLELSGT
jgi:hypothetical protein